MNKEYPIRVVTKITGLSADQIRKWEERYSILNITRSMSATKELLKAETDDAIQKTAELLNAGIAPNQKRS